ncbi:hypothetical protein KR093_007430 [Drosophila rubida]|uniref:Major facilitator superfamily (MFS) profile domain-containing protein n=1 Tax=Drosophila rubida TaxID=30044 RepID=A0AAD4K2V2_9MUSC|nr:hypothetical protein KR093_007430 [Drosophila rubida]
MQNDKYMPPQPPAYGFSSSPPSEEPQHGYPPQGYPQHGYPPQGYPQQGYPQHGYPPQGYPAQNYPSPPPTGFSPPPAHNYGAPPPPQSYAPPPAPPPPTNGWYTRNRINKPQSNAAGAASLIFLSGGMNIAWSIGFRPYFYGLVTLHMGVAWFIAAIIGALISSLLANKIPKKLVVIFASVLVIVGGIIRAATHYKPNAIEASLYMDGIANGLAFVPTMALVGEVAWPYMRGPIAASIEQMCYTLGIFLQIIYTESWGVDNSYYYNSFSSEQMHGVFSIIFGVIALIIAAFLCIESPVIMLANGEEQRAIDTLRRLQHPYTITTETYVQLEEHKRYLAHNKDLSMSTSLAQAFQAFVRLVYLRALNVMSISGVVFFALFISVLPHYSLYNFMWQYIVFGLCRFLGNFVASFGTESLGRKKPTLLGLLLSGGFCFGIASMLADFPYGAIDSIVYLIFVYQVFASIAFAPSSVYLTEAYPLGVKQHFIGFTYIVEMLVFIIIASADVSISGVKIYFYIVGGLSVFGAILGIWCLPETRGTTLREAQEKFKSMFNRAF